MEQVITDERTLETELKSYEDQLELVEQQLQVSGQEDDEGLVQLKADLTELIGLTQDNLAEVKKRKLLLALEGSDISESLIDTSTNDTTSAATTSNDTDDISGTKCRAPLKESWGAVNYHNAIMVCTEVEEDDDVEVKVRVMFTHPTYNKMKPCSYFLDGMCKFDEDTCKFSHGTVVLYSECLPYNEADLSKVSLERKCLAKHTDGLWHPAIISTVEPGVSTVGIHYTDTKEDVDLELDNVYPLDSSSDSSSSEEQEDEIEDDDNEVVKVISSTPGTTTLGYWEEHTNGIGSKLLQKMGYVYGKGLGKKGEGRLEPVEIVILPNGLSLDACIKLKESKKLRTVGEQPSKRRCRKKRKQAMQKAANTTEPKDETHFFNFLEKTLQSQSKAGNAEDNAKAQVNKMSGQTLNVELFKLDEDKKVIEKKIQSLRSALQRHRGRDKQMESHVTSKLQEAQKTLKQLQDRETLIQTKVSQNKNKHKLAIF
ncbi:zinc finger CCCH-type with G patch domain-containing protein-like [Dysidea avara]|uniref:zinc finger CCCH-type with G patch domain-containing protein-like n=1 Tax=Dysidea avara TaxID=196820 RepID=UPI00331A153B